jgi:ribosomal protein S25
MHRIFLKKCFLFKIRSVCRVKRFTTGSRNSLKHVRKLHDTRPGRPAEIATEAAVQRVEDWIGADRRITIESVATAVGCSHGLAYSIMHDRLKFRKVCARRVPRELKE